MIGKKIIKQLSQLPFKDWKYFLRWLESPIHNTDERLYQLGLHFKDQITRPSQAHTDKEALWEKIYPGKPLNEGVLRVKLRQLGEQLEDFIVWHHLKRHRKNHYNQLYLESQLKSTTFEQYERQLRSKLNQIEGTPTPNIHYYYDRAYLLHLLLSHPQRSSYLHSNTDAVEYNTALDNFFILSKLRLATQLKNRSMILREGAEISFIEAILTAIEQPPLASNPSAQLYLQHLRLLDHQVDIATFKHLFLSQHSSITKTDRHTIYFSTLNYLSRRINTGQQQSYQETLDWYQLGLTDGLLIQNGSITEVSFSNIALLGYECGQFEWVDTFFQQYQEYLLPKVRKSTIIANSGLGLFHQQKYAEAVRLLKSHYFPLAYQLRTRLTTVRALYELLRLNQLDNIDAIYKPISAFEAYLRRNKKFSESTLLPYINHLNFLRRMILQQLNVTNDQDEITTLWSELQNEPTIVAKKWLTAKINQLPYKSK